MRTSWNDFLKNSEILLVFRSYWSSLIFELLQAATIHAMVRPERATAGAASTSVGNLGGSSAEQSEGPPPLYPVSTIVWIALAVVFLLFLEIFYSFLVAFKYSGTLYQRQETRSDKQHVKVQASNRSHEGSLHRKGIWTKWVFRYEIFCSEAFDSALLISWSFRAKIGLIFALIAEWDSAVQMNSWLVDWLHLVRPIDHSINRSIDQAVEVIYAL